MEIKIRYTWKHIKSGEIKQRIEYIENIECSQLLKDRCFMNPLWELIARDLWTGMVDRNNRDVFVNDKILDCLTKMDYVVLFGLCKKHAYTGFYCESDEGRQTTLNPDYDTNKNGAIEVFDNIHINPINTNTNG